VARGAGGAASRGREVRQAARTARGLNMLEFFGIGVGSIEIQLERFGFYPGDTIRGQVVLKLRAPQSARAVVVGLRARQKVVQRRFSPRDPVLTYRTETVWEFKRELAGEGAYQEGSYPFELVVPSDVFRPEAEPPSGIVWDIARAIVFPLLQGERRYPLQWQVFAAVSRPFKVDVKKKVDVVVTERPAG